MNPTQMAILLGGGVVMLFMTGILGAHVSADDHALEAITTWLGLILLIAVAVWLAG